MADSVYRVTEVIGVSSESWEAAAQPCGRDGGQVGSRSSNRGGDPPGCDDRERQGPDLPRPPGTLLQVRGRQLEERQPAVRSGRRPLARPRCDGPRRSPRALRPRPPGRPAAARLRAARAPAPRRRLGHAPGSLGTASLSSPSTSRPQRDSGSIPQGSGPPGRRPDRSASSWPSTSVDDVGGARSEHAQAGPGAAATRRHPQVAVGARAVAQRQERVVVAGDAAAIVDLGVDVGRRPEQLTAPGRRDGCRDRAGRRRPRAAPAVSRHASALGSGRQRSKRDSYAGRHPSRPPRSACAACGGRSPSAGSETP